MTKSENISRDAYLFAIYGNILLRQFGESFQWPISGFSLSSRTRSVLIRAIFRLLCIADFEKSPVRFFCRFQYNCWRFCGNVKFSFRKRKWFCMQFPGLVWIWFFLFIVRFSLVKFIDFQNYVRSIFDVRSYVWSWSLKIWNWMPK